MKNHELIMELLLQNRELPIRLELIDHDDVTFYYSPVYSVRIENEDLVISGVPPEILKKFEEE